MTITYTFDVFSSLDGFGSYDINTGDWGGYASVLLTELSYWRLT